MGIVIFLGLVIIVLILVFSLGGGRKKKRAQVFEERMKETLQKAVPDAVGFDVVMAQGSKDTLSSLKDAGGELLAKASVKAIGASLGLNLRLRTEYMAPPSFIIGYKGREMYVVCVGEHPSFDKLIPDDDFVLHLTPDNLEKVLFAIGGKITFKLKDTSAALVVTVTNFAVTMLEQPENNKRFKEYISDFVQKYSLE